MLGLQRETTYEVYTGLDHHIRPKAITQVRLTPHLNFKCLTSIYCSIQHKTSAVFYFQIPTKIKREEILNNIRPKAITQDIN